MMTNCWIYWIFLHPFNWFNRLNKEIQTLSILLTFAPAMEINCTKKELALFKKIGQAAKELELPCYIIGGFVRDKIIGRATKDADIMCVGDGIELAHKVASMFTPRPPVAYFK